MPTATVAVSWVGPSASGGAAAHGVVDPHSVGASMSGPASTEPAEFLGLGTMLGRIDQGFRADMVAFDPSHIEVLETWVAGQAANHKARH